MPEESTTMMQHGDVRVDLEELRTLVAEILDVEIAEVTDDAHFVEDLEVDSLMALEIVVRLEKHYGVKLADSDLGSVTSLGATRELLDGKLAAR